MWKKAKTTSIKNTSSYTIQSGKREKCCATKMMQNTVTFLDKYIHGKWQWKCKSNEQEKVRGHEMHFQLGFLGEKS